MEITKEEISLESLVVTASKMYVITEPEAKGLILEGVVGWEGSPIMAVKHIKERVAKMRMDNITNKIAAKVQVASHTSLVMVSKIGVLGSALTVEELIDDEKLEILSVGPICIEKNYFSKSFVVDAREVDPEVEETIGSMSEIDVKKIEIAIIHTGAHPITVSYTFSGYDKGCDITSKTNLKKKLRQQPCYYLDPMGDKEVRLIVDMAQVRAYYTYKSTVHKKFDKYNPRQYCYFTLYADSEYPIGEINFLVRRIFREVAEPAGRIYKGPVLRKGKVTFKNDKFRHRYKFCKTHSKPQKSSALTQMRQQILNDAFALYGQDKGEQSRWYSLEKVRKEMNITEIKEENGVMRYEIFAATHYKMEDRTAWLQSLTPDQFEDEIEADYDKIRSTFSDPETFWQDGDTNAILKQIT